MGANPKALVHANQSLVLTCRSPYALIHTVRFDGEKLKALRDSRKWDQHRAAEAARSYGVGITQSQISRYENGIQEPTGRNALALAAAFDVDVRELYCDDADDEEAAQVFVSPPSLDDFLRLHIRQLVRAEMQAVAR